jgi:hypothetical protein
MDLIMDVNNTIHGTKWCLTIVIATRGKEKMSECSHENETRHIKTIGEMGQSKLKPLCRRYSLEDFQEQN